MTILFAILLFSLLIFVHELGHFIAAKLSGVQVNEFSMFMGPTIVKWQRGETTYSIRSIPIGGFCAMEGEDADSDNPRSFQKAAWWKRLIILVAGAAMNFVTGFLLLAITFAPAEAMIIPVIADADAACTVVYEAGLHVGDRILKVDGEKIYMSSDFSMILSLNPGDVHDLVVERDGDKVKVNYKSGDTGTAQRTAIGQRADGSVIFLVTDGRTASSLGATPNDVIGIMLEYGAVTAAMLDGGSSSMMYYRDYIEKLGVDESTLDQYQKIGLLNKYKAFVAPRRIPTYFIVAPEGK